MGQRTSVSASERRLTVAGSRIAAEVYDGLNVAELERLVSLRGIETAPHSLDRDMLKLLLRAYDVGAQGVESRSREKEVPLRPATQNVDGGDLPTACKPGVFEVLQILRDSPGHMGVDIGGTLVKVVMAVPKSVAGTIVLPSNFGTTGQTHHQLGLTWTVGGESLALIFVSGSTSWMELAVKDLGKTRHEPIRRGTLTGIDEATPVMDGSTSEHQDFEAVDKQPSMSGKLRGWSDFGSPNYRPLRRIATAGGGACKFAPLFREALRLDIEPVKELAAVVDGLLLLASQASATVGDNGNGGDVSGELFTIGPDGSSVPLPWPQPLFPLLVVNMGSGVSILRVDSASGGDFVRVGGTACGGATFLGLSRVLTSAKTFEAALALAEKGEASRADKLVGDIYGEEGSKTLGLSSALTAANFGKLSDSSNTCSEADLARSLLQMITQQSVLLASAFAKHANCVDRVFFVGGFVDSANRLSRQTIAANFRSLGGCAYFLRHCDFLGALGSLAGTFNNTGSCDDCRSSDAVSPEPPSPSLSRRSDGIQSEPVPPSV